MGGVFQKRDYCIGVSLYVKSTELPMHQVVKSIKYTLAHFLNINNSYSTLQVLLVFHCVHKSWFSLHPFTL